MTHPLSGCAASPHSRSAALQAGGRRQRLQAKRLLGTQAKRRLGSEAALARRPLNGAAPVACAARRF